MKLRHTPLGTLVSKKKIIASVAALALVGEIAPALIKNTNALYVSDYTDSDIVYTTVGPDYFTVTGFDADEIYNEDYELYVADTSVADFTDNDSYFAYSGGYCYEKYQCLQGKKIGDTEIIVEQDGREVKRIAVKSVELLPEAKNSLAFGEDIDGTGSLNGADDSLLVLRDYDEWGGANVTLTGERSFSINTPQTSEYYSAWASANLVWTIGDQLVGGGTYYDFLRIEAIDHISNLEENEAALKDIALSFMNRIDASYGYDITDDLFEAYDDRRDVYGIESSDGSIGNVYYSVRERISPKSYTIELNFKEDSPSASVKNELTAGLPEGAKVMSVNGIEAAIYASGIDNSSIIELESVDRSVNLLNAQIKQAVPPLPSAGFEYTTVKYADLTKLGKDVTISLDVSDIEAVAEGKARTWYVVAKNGDKVEQIESVYDEKTKTLSFPVNILGDYAYGYVDEEIKTEPAEESVVPKVPNTGSPIQKVAKTAAITFAPLAAIVLGAFMVRNKKKASNKLAKKHNHFA